MYMYIHHVPTAILWHTVLAHPNRRVLPRDTRVAIPHPSPNHEWDPSKHNSIRTWSSVRHDPVPRFYTVLAHRPRPRTLRTVTLAPRSRVRRVRGTPRRVDWTLWQQQHHRIVVVVVVAATGVVVPPNWKTKKTTSTCDTQ